MWSVARRLEGSLYRRAHNFPSHPSLLSLLSRIFHFADRGGLLGGEGEGCIGDPVLLGASTEFDLCWYFQEAALIECFSRGSATHLLRLDYSIVIWRIGVGEGGESIIWLTFC